MNTLRWVVLLQVVFLAALLVSIFTISKLSAVETPVSFEKLLSSSAEDIGKLSLAELPWLSSDQLHLLGKDKLDALAPEKLNRLANGRFAEFRHTFLIIVALGGCVWSAAVLLHLLLPNGPVKTEEIGRATYTTFVGVVAGAFAAASYSALAQNGTAIRQLFAGQQTLIKDLDDTVMQQNKVVAELVKTLEVNKNIRETLAASAMAIDRSALAQSATADHLKEFAASDERTAGALAVLNQQYCRQTLYAAIETRNAAIEAFDARKQLAELTARQSVSANIAEQTFSEHQRLARRDIFDRVWEIAFGLNSREKKAISMSGSGSGGGSALPVRATITPITSAEISEACENPAKLNAKLAELAESAPERSSSLLP